MPFRLALVCLGGLALAAPGAPLRVQGSATATAPFTAAYQKLRAAGLDVAFNTESNTSGAIAAVGEKAADLAVTTRPISAEERATWPGQRMEERVLGVQLLTLVVSKDVWDSGLRALDKEQVRRIYEKEVTNWKELGGADHPIRFFNPESGHGVWELLATWLYGDVRRAPLGGDFPKVNGGDETRNTIEFHSGALSVVSPLWPDGRGTYALSIKAENGDLLPATVEAARDKNYPLARKLAVISADRPLGELKKLIEFFFTPAGADCLRKADYLPLSDAPPTP